eukprot:CAMPEP_0194543810 /NCGR_PEP_ID=MMETSP0253-20130528/86449_1 /TAXON_ID=2966 /ORGANISM="Noctiluca scintillans" /LENGTH=66 /DNA_ID=CAMNT_0039390613 /DNA_START=11 /DNA_END=208 /DNA_ORIENTATION=+
MLKLKESGMNPALAIRQSHLPAPGKSLRRAQPSSRMVYEAPSGCRQADVMRSIQVAPVLKAPDREK